MPSPLISPNMADELAAVLAAALAPLHAKIDSLTALLTEMNEEIVELRAKVAQGAKEAEKPFAATTSTTNPLTASLPLPSHAIYVHQKFASEGLTRLDYDVVMHNSPPTSMGSYFSPYNATIDGERETDLD